MFTYPKEIKKLELIGRFCLTPDIGLEGTQNLCSPVQIHRIAHACSGRTQQLLETITRAPIAYA
jgi:hypothetical protein